MAYEVVMSYHLHMPSYFLGTFTEYPYDKKLLSPATDTVELTDPKLIHSWNRKKLTRIRFTIVSQQISGESKLVIRKVQYHKTLND